MLGSTSVSRSVLITVCICTKDRPAYVGRCLAGLAEQSVPTDSFEIILIDSGSSLANARMLELVAQNIHNLTLIRVDQPGLSRARNAAARVAKGFYIAYIDDDAVPDRDWLEQISRSVLTTDKRPALIGGRILPIWEAQLPHWWPSGLRGVLSLIEFEGRGEYRSAALPAGAEPYGANLVVNLADLISIGGFSEGSGRTGYELLSDEDVQLAWRLQNAGKSVRYDSRIGVRHHVQSNRLNVDWLLSRLYWQGVSTVRTRRSLGEYGLVRRLFFRRLVVCIALFPTRLIRRRSPVLLSCRWRHSYSLGFVRAFFE